VAKDGRWIDRAVPVLPLLALPLAFVAVLRSGTPAPYWRAARPHEPRDAVRCTWSCHNHGCEHAQRLPRALSIGLFDRAVLGLHDLGDRLAPGDRFSGYRAANLIVFCALWPAAMYGLYLVALRQRRALHGRSRA
jgi:hypothetical protein